MSTVDTTDEATAVLAAAVGAQGRKDWDTAGPLLESLRDSTVVTGEQWTEVRFRLGDVRWHTGDVDGARELYDQAAVGQGEYAAQATARMAELDRSTAAGGAAADGVEADELDTVINGAGEALMRGDHADALALYVRAWGLPNIEPLRQGMIALGQAQCLLALARYAEAKEWFGYLQQFGDGMYDTDAEAGLAQIAAHEGAVAAAGDGAQVGEVALIFHEATESYNRGDVAAAKALWESVLANPTLPAEKQAVVHFNLGQTHILLDDEETARTHFLQGLGIGAGGDVDAWCNERLDMLDAQDAALKTAGILPL